MKFKRPTCPALVEQRGRAAFTLIEMLVALALMAVLIPVATHCVRIASLAEEIAARKVTAARIAERVLNETMATHDWRQGSQSGAVQEGFRTFNWTMLVEPWNQANVNGNLGQVGGPGNLSGNLSLVSVQVSFLVQSRIFDVRLCTVANTTEQ